MVDPHAPPGKSLDDRLDVAGRSALSPLAPSQAQFQNLRASVTDTLPSAFILALPPSHGGSACGSFDSLDDKIDAAAAGPGAIVAPILCNYSSQPQAAAAFKPPASDSQVVASPVAAMPYSVPKHHSRKSWALLPSSNLKVSGASRHSISYFQKMRLLKSSFRSSSLCAVFKNARRPCQLVAPLLALATPSRFS